MTTNRFQLKPLAAAGLVSGLAQVGAGVILYLSGNYYTGWSALVSLLVLAAGIAFGVRWYVTRVLGGRSTYWTAWLAGIVISISTAIVYVAYNVVSISFLYPNFLEDQARLTGTTATIATIVVSNLIGLSVRGTVLSALVAIAFRNKHSHEAQRH